jgi:hypothetical protein
MDDEEITELKLIRLTLCYSLLIGTVLQAVVTRYKNKYVELGECASGLSRGAFS